MGPEADFDAEAEADEYMVGPTLYEIDKLLVEFVPLPPVAALEQRLLTGMLADSGSLRLELPT